MPVSWSSTFKVNEDCGAERSEVLAGELFHEKSERK